MLEDFKVPVKLKLSALWASVMFCYSYCDFFTFMVPGHIQSLMNGETGAGPATPIKLLLFAVMMSIPSCMIFLTLALKPAASRWANIVFGIIYTIIMVLVVSTSFREWLLFYIYFGAIEIVLTMVITVQAWRWPAAGASLPPAP